MAGLVFCGVMSAILLAVGVVTIAQSDHQPVIGAARQQPGLPVPVPQPGVPSQATDPDTTVRTETRGNGTFLIGNDIEPGDYQATVPADSPLCYWERLSAISGEVGDIIANGVAEPGDHLTVTLLDSDKAFSSSGCGPWRKV